MDNLLQSMPIVHVGYMTDNREKTMAQLEKIYDIKEWQMVEWKPDRVVYNGVETLNDYYIKIAISLPNEGTRIEVLEPVTPGIHMDLLKSGQILSHTCHVVKDYDAVTQHFLDCGCELVFESEYTDTIRGYRRANYLYDPIIKTYYEIAEVPYFRNKEA